MTTVTAIGVVIAIVQFFKKLLPGVVQGTVAVILVFLSSFGVTAYKFISEGNPLSFAAISFMVSVIVGALSGYSLLKVAGGKIN